MTQNVAPPQLAIKGWYNLYMTLEVLLHLHFRHEVLDCTNVFLKALERDLRLEVDCTVQTSQYLIILEGMT